MSVLVIGSWALDTEGLVWQHGQEFDLIGITTLESSAHFCRSLAEDWCLRLEMTVHLG